MAHEHSVFDQDPHFIVDEHTRQIKYQGDTLPQIVQHDHNSERFTFQLPKTVDGHDMTLCNDIRVNYINVDSSTKETSKGAYPVEDLAALENDETKIALSWLVSGNATKFAGKLSFMLCFMCKDAEGNITYRWNTLINGDLVVGNGMDNGEAIVEEYPDILEAWRREVLAEIPEIPEHTWESLPDKPFGEVDTRKLVKEFIVDRNNWGGTIWLDQCENERVIVTLNGEEYESTCVFDTGTGFFIISLDNGVTIRSGIVDGWCKIVGLDESMIPCEVKIERIDTVNQPIDEQYIPESISRTNHAHSFNDLNDKPFSKTIEEVPYFTEATVMCNGSSSYYSDDKKALETGKTYIVVFDGNRYECEITMHNRLSQPCLGNQALYSPNENTVDSGEPFLLRFNAFSIDNAKDFTPSVTENGTEHTIAVYYEDEIVTPLNEEFIPESIARITDIPDAVINPATATVGQTIVVKAVDESGKPTEWEAVDMPSGGVTSWNDLDDRPFGEEFAWEDTLVKDVTVTDGVAEISSEDGWLWSTGNDIKVIFDGVEYVFVSDGGMVDEMGDANRVEYPFHITVGMAAFIGFVNIEADPATDHTVTIQQYTVTTVRTLDKKYLPKANAISNVAAAPTALEFNTLLAVLRTAGYLATE